jgi:hypothetical protein
LAALADALAEAELLWMERRALATAAAMDGSRAVTTSVTRVSWLTPAALWTPGRSSWGAAAARPIATHRDINTCTIRICKQ